MDKEKKRDKFYREVDLLFSRFHFFLVATSFLILAFVTLVTSNLCPTVREPLGHAIAAFASCLSIAFFLINYLTATMLKPPNDKKQKPDIEDKLNERDQSDKEQKLDKEDVPIERLSRFPVGMVKFILDPLNYSVDHKACHTWVIPLAFYVFWGVAWGISLSWIGPLWCLIGLLLLFLSWTCTAKLGLGREDRGICVPQWGRWVLRILITAALIASWIQLEGSLTWLFMLIPILGLAYSVVGLSSSRSGTIGRKCDLAVLMLCLAVMIVFAISHT